LIKKINRHDARSVSTPEITVPDVPPSPARPPQIPSAFIRSRGSGLDHRRRDRLERQLGERRQDLGAQQRPVRVAATVNFKEVACSAPAITERERPSSRTYTIAGSPRAR
jgi:hypothetical protein